MRELLPVGCHLSNDLKRTLCVAQQTLDRHIQNVPQAAKQLCGGMLSAL